MKRFGEEIDLLDLVKSLESELEDIRKSHPLEGSAGEGKLLGFTQKGTHVYTQLGQSNKNTEMHHQDHLDASAIHFDAVNHYMQQQYSSKNSKAKSSARALAAHHTDMAHYHFHKGEAGTKTGEDPDVHHTVSGLLQQKSKLLDRGSS